MARVAVRLSGWVGAVLLPVALTVPAHVFAQTQAGPYGADTLKALEQKKKDADAQEAAKAKASGVTAPASTAAPTRTSGTAAPAAAPATSAGDRDPFEPLVSKPREGEDRPSLSGLRLVGVLWDASHRDQIRALVETPDGLGYYLRVNEEKFGGKVVGIDRDRVRFSVREQDPAGQVRTRTVELKLSQ
jgi:Tfp pilus assembly protein PilP